VPNHQKPPTTRCQGHDHQTHQTNYHPNTRVTWSQTCHLPPTTRSTGAKVLGCQSTDPTTIRPSGVRVTAIRPTRHPGHRVTGSQGHRFATCHFTTYHQGVKVPRCQSHHHQNIGLPSTRSTDSPDHRSHLSTRLTGARATSHRVTDPPLITRHRATIHTDHQLPRSHGHQPPTTLSTEPPTHLSHRCQWCLSHHPPRTNDPPEPLTTKPIWIGQTHPYHHSI
jgi:hypothetical protein